MRQQHQEEGGGSEFRPGRASQIHLHTEVRGKKKFSKTFFHKCHTAVTPKAAAHLKSLEGKLTEQKNNGTGSCKLKYN